MNCTCITDQEKRIQQGFDGGKLEAPKGKKVRRIHCNGMGLNFTTGRVNLAIEFTADIEGQRKTMPVRMVAAFCPFCGESTHHDEAGK